MTCNCGGSTNANQEPSELRPARRPGRARAAAGVQQPPSVPRSGGPGAKQGYYWNGPHSKAAPGA